MLVKEDELLENTGEVLCVRQKHQPAVHSFERLGNAGLFGKTVRYAMKLSLKGK